MHNQAVQDYGQLEDDDCPDEFRCCVCLDIVYKPVVLACGHISCFWCVFNAMDSTGESHCPVCRKAFNHFPRVCELMHFLLMNLYPSAYRWKEREVAEEEKKYGHTSPQLDIKLSDSQFPVDIQYPASPLPEAVPKKPNATCGGDHPFVQDSIKGTCHDEDNITNIPTTSSSQEANCVVENTKLKLLPHLVCAVCKKLLCRPVVLNCGHVYCEACISQDDNACKCPKCQSAHPNGLPNVCLVLEHFLEEHFPEEYSARKESVSTFKNANSSQGSIGKREQAAKKHWSMSEYLQSFFNTGSGPKMHYCVGCDYCGMYPIVGERYRCKDCSEKIGFDLCENCYNSSSKLPGRFNQQHTPDHQFEVVQPRSFQNIFLIQGVHYVDDEVQIVVSSDSGGPLTSNLSNEASEGELEITTSANTLDIDSRNSEEATTSRNSPHNHSQDQRGNSGT